VDVSKIGVITIFNFEIRTLIRSESYFRNFWDILIIITAVILCILLPIHIAFQPAFLALSGAYRYFTIFVDVLFVVDLLLQFRTTYINDTTGEEVYSSKEIAINYLKGKFAYDLMATIPLDFLIAKASDQTQSEI